ncbi:histamine H2 receptor-like [Asterias amurensis]|uniref:histamine H2 receptor-like n=1 Tax=Asterias amurensis TaxID=7602 RepID=UPI003AB1DD87
MNSTSTDAVGLSPVLTALRTCFIAIIALLIISGNILSIAVTRRVTNLADSTKVLMTSLAVSDLLVGCIALLTVVVSALDRWPFGDVCCSISAVFTSTSYFMSILSLTFLNMERYIAVTRPYKFPIWCTRSRTILLVTMASLFCFATGPLFIVSFKSSVEYFRGSLVCYYSDKQIYFKTITLLLAFVLPLLFMSFIYYHLIKISRQHERRLNQNRNNEANNNHDNKALKTFLVVTLTFACCYTPLIFSRTVESLLAIQSPNWLRFLTLWPVHQSVDSRCGTTTYHTELHFYRRESSIIN